MKALVTGANGFTGSHLTSYLLRKGYGVRVLVRQGADLAALDGLPVEHAYADLADGSPLDAAVRGVDTVFHVAAAYRREGMPRRAFREVNVGGTRRLLEAAKRVGVRRFVHCSTVGVQGWIRHPPATETTPYAPGDHYQVSKRDGEQLALDFFRASGLPGTVVRPTAIYGPGDTRLLKLFTFIDRGTFRMIGDGRTLYHLVYVEDLVAGMVLAAQKAEAVGEVITIGGDEYLPISDLVARIAVVLNKPVPRRRMPVWPVWLAGLLCEAACRPLGLEPPLYRRRVEFFIKDRAFDISKARRLLGYEPKVSLDEGLRRTAAWYRQQGLLNGSRRQAGPEAPEARPDVLERRAS
jgi:nucleoside-diphosphate-sugar epimerase